MIFLPPLKLSYGEDFSNTFVWYVDARAKNFTGWTGTWTISRPDRLLLNGVLTLTSLGQITTTISVSSVNTLVPYLPTRGFTIPGTVWAANLTNGTEALVFNAAVQLIRNKTTVSPFSAILPGWVL